MLLGAIVIAYLLIAAQYASRTPAWQAPDEPAHYNYVRYIVDHRALPILQFGDYDQSFNEQFTNPANTPNLPIDPLRYEYHQPPLYYLIATPFYDISQGDLFTLRLLSGAFGGALIVVAYRIVRTLMPDRSTIALGVAAFIAFVPQHVAMLSAVNNDALAELLLALALLQLFRVLQRDSEDFHDLIPLGILLGLGLITKTTNYLALPVVFIGLFVRSDKFILRPSAFAFRRLALVFIPALAIGCLWWLRNLGLYGGFDALGLARHNAIVVGQPLTFDWIASMGFGPYLINALSTTFHSFWGQFGWMGVVMPDAFYLALGILSVIALIGWLLILLRARFVTPTPLYLLLFLLTLFTMTTYIWYNFTFVQFQGRYLFPALIPIGIVFAIGIKHWTDRLPSRIGLIAYALVFVALAALDVYALYRFIIPALNV